MGSAIKTRATTFTASPQERVEAFLAHRMSATNPPVVAMTPDASTRFYFRVPWKRGTAFAAVYPEPFDEAVHPYLDVTRLFRECELPVPEVYDVDGSLGIIMQEDLGDNQLCAIFETANEDEREALIEQSIEIIARIQAAT